MQSTGEAAVDVTGSGVFSPLTLTAMNGFFAISAGLRSVPHAAVAHQSPRRHGGHAGDQATEKTPPFIGLKHPSQLVLLQFMERDADFLRET
jgi:hypothetical protein